MNDRIGVRAPHKQTFKDRYQRGKVCVCSGMGAVFSMCACIRSDYVHLCRRKVIIPGVLQHFRPGWKDQTKSRGRTHTNIDTHKYTQTYIHIYACTLLSPAAFSYPRLLQLPHVWTLSTERRETRESTVLLSISTRLLDACN